MASRLVTSALSVGAALLMIAGCSVSANLTVSPVTVEETAADALEGLVGIRPEMDCGSNQIDLVEGNAVICELTDPTTGARFDTTVTFEDVDGTDFVLDVQVADEPNN